MKYIKISWHAFQVAEDFIIQTIIKGYRVNAEQYSLNENGKLYIAKYYAWDGPTGAWPTESFLKGSCPHDVLCDMINSGLLPATVQYLADEEMRQINNSGSMWKPRVVWTYLMVRLHMLRKRKWTPRKVYEV